MKIIIYYFFKCAYISFHYFVKVNFNFNLNISYIYSLKIMVYILTALFTHRIFWYIYIYILLLLCSKYPHSNSFYFFLKILPFWKWDVSSFKKRKIKTSKCAKNLHVILKSYNIATLRSEFRYTFDLLFISNYPR